MKIPRLPIFLALPFTLLIVGAARPGRPIPETPVDLGAVYREIVSIDASYRSGDHSSDTSAYLAALDRVDALIHKLDVIEGHSAIPPAQHPTRRCLIAAKLLKESWNSASVDRYSQYFEYHTPAERKRLAEEALREKERRTEEMLRTKDEAIAACRASVGSLKSTP
jgi:hypothetical protein